jgi:cysteinyl-tRNA synthetase
MTIHIYNSLSREKEIFTPVKDGSVSMYTCGPTVYDYPHIGNLRTSTFMDVVRRALTFLGYDVTSVMNITDVEDKIERRAAEKGVTVDEIVSTYEKVYFDCLKKLNISADLYPHASDHIQEQIELIQNLEEKGYTYLTDYGVYFDISKDTDYGKLGNTFKSDKAKSRIELTEQKRNPEDFVLWRLPQNGEVRQKLWESPWGKGYPGWHIECSAMSMKTLTNSFDSGHLNPKNFETIDIHVGGLDLKEVHHENEVAQSESVTGHPFVKYWMHGAMLNMGSEKMSKSLGNFVTLPVVEEKGFTGLDLRMFYFTAHYRKELSFTWEGLEAAKTSLHKFRAKYFEFANGSDDTEEMDSVDVKFELVQNYLQQFKEALADDFNMPKALAILWEVVDSKDLKNFEKTALLSEFDEVFGFDITDYDKLQKEVSIKLDELPENVKNLLQKREQYRKEKDWQKADEARKEIKQLGYEIKDIKDGILIEKVIS